MKIPTNIIENINDQDDDLSYWSALKNQTSSVYDLLNYTDLSHDELDAVFCKNENSSNCKLYAKVKNLNASTDNFYQECIAPKSAIEVGIKFEF
jgi:hypothetical protein